MVSASTPLHFIRKKERIKTDSGFYKGHTGGRRQLGEGRYRLLS